MKRILCSTVQDRDRKKADTSFYTENVLTTKIARKLFLRNKFIYLKNILEQLSILMLSPYLPTNLYISIGELDVLNKFTF